RCIKTANSQCSVCGKAATGIHYLCVSCNGCRSFFRRTIALNKKYDCRRAGDDTKECFNRYRCRKCRLTLCLAAGMNPDAVQTEEDGNDEMGDLPEDLQVIDI
ncbi:hypothetical protein PENTCL1PPCAC_26673, partial [Pristionchus entomophagus]